MNTTMLPCPWCRSVIDKINIKRGHFGVTYIQCHKCGCKGPDIDSLHMTPELKKKKAIAAWNNRKE